MQQIPNHELDVSPGNNLSKYSGEKIGAQSKRIGKRR